MRCDGRQKGGHAMRAWMLLLVVVTLGCGEEPQPVAGPGQVARPEPVAEPGPVAEEPKPTTARVIGRDEAIAEIEKLGGTYQCDEQSPDRRIVGVALRGPHVTDATLEQLKS